MQHLVKKYSFILKANSYMFDIKRNINLQLYSFHQYLSLKISLGQALYMSDKL